MKNLLASFLLPIIIFSPLSSVWAQSTEDQLDALTASLLVIGQAITSSPDLSDKESLALMMQLVTVSNAVSSIREAHKKRGQDKNASSTDKDKVSAKEARLERVFVSYDAKSEVIITKLRYSSTTLEKSFNFTPLASKTTYGEKLSQVIADMENDVSDTTGVIKSDIKDLMFVTSWNTIRDTEKVIQNSTLAYNLAENFAKYSIVNKVEIRPGETRGEIEFYTDQDESLRFSLVRNVDENGAYLGNYKYIVQFFFPAPLTPVSDTVYSFDNTQTVEIPQYEQVSPSVSEEDILDFVLGLSTDAPFAGVISDFDNRLISFLTRNKTHFATDNVSVYDDRSLECYRPSDRKIVTKFVSFLAESLDLQFEDVETMTQYQAPLRQMEDAGASNGRGCSQEKRFF